MSSTKQTILPHFNFFFLCASVLTQGKTTSITSNKSTHHFENDTIKPLQQLNVINDSEWHLGLSYFVTTES